MPIIYLYPQPKNLPPKPQNFAQMLQIAKVLGSLFNFVRVDLYSLKNRIIIGELTLTSEGGAGKFTPFEWDKKWGDLWA